MADPIDPSPREADRTRVTRAAPAAGLTVPSGAELASRPQRSICPICGAAVAPASLALPDDAFVCATCGTTHKPEPDLAEHVHLVAGPSATEPNDLPDDLPGDQPDDLPGDLTRPPKRPDQELPDLALALRAARVGRNANLAAASASTCIPERHLRTLEDGEPVDPVPGVAYARFFVQEYARYLGLDERPLLRAFEARYGDDRRPVLLPLARVAKDQARTGRWASRALVAVAAIAMALIVIHSFLPSSAGGTARFPAAPSPTSRSPAPSVSAQPASDRHPPPSSVPHGVQAVLELAGRSWIEASADGTALASKTFGPGRPLTFDAKHRLLLTLGDAGAVRSLRVNGERVPTGGSGEVIHLALSTHNGRVIATPAA